MSHIPSPREQQVAGVPERHQHADVVDARRTDETAVDRHDAAYERFGGFNWGSCFFGWLVAIAIAILLTSIVGAVVAAVGSSTNVTQSDAERQAGDIGLAAGIVLLLVLAIGYYFGGYVAGRMSRFDGGRQGLGVWLIGLVVTIVAIALGAIFGSQYNLLDRVSLPNLPISTDQLGWGALITALAVLALTLLAALLGGKAGQRYHHRVDRAARPA
jgi:magnesium-transporting ATPase (P-type)